ncbi:MAG TPA: type IV secretion system DNA-binding domain-containing protein [Edaphobacter sp.]|nr:type IV secretion system DNA-binding domain-containing protein [Edaphobacter sp.]
MNDLLELLNLTPEQAVGCAVAGGLIGLLSKRRKQIPKAPRDVLDTPLLQWSTGEPYTVRHLLANTLILGATGSGKTSGSGRHLMRAIVRYPGSGGLILCAKPEDADDVRAIFQNAGRRDDLLVVQPDGELRCNFIEYGGNLSSNSTREITQTLTTIGESLRSVDKKGGDGEEFWSNEAERMLYNAVEIIRLAKGRVNGPDLQKFLTTALRHPSQVTSESWAGCFHDKCMRAAFDAPKTASGRHDYELAQDYFFRQLPNTADRTRSSIEIVAFNLLHVFNSGLVREMCSTTSNCSPDDMLKGRYVMVNMSPSQYGFAGNFVNAGWKYLTQKMILKRKAEANDPPIVLWIDEFQQSVSSHDPPFLAQCRSHRGCQVMLTQSIHSLIGAMKGRSGNSDAISLMSNANHKIFHALGDAETAEYASRLLGREERVKVSNTLQPDEDMFSAMFGPPKMSTNVSEQWEPTLEPGVFFRLPTGGPQNTYQTGAIVIKAGEPFPNGGNWRYVQFDQRG